MVRDEFYDEFIKVYEEEKRKEHYYIHIPDIAAKVLKTENLERFDYEETVKLQEKRDAKWRAIEEKRERLKLTGEHFQWRSLYYNNDSDMFENGKYTLIFKEVEGKVVGYRFSILYQKSFYTFTVKNMNSRITTLLGELGLMDRLVNTFLPLTQVGWEIDYGTVNQKLEVLKKDSMDYLKQALDIE